MSVEQSCDLEQVHVIPVDPAKAPGEDSAPRGGEGWDLQVMSAQGQLEPKTQPAVHQLSINTPSVGDFAQVATLLGALAPSGAACGCLLSAQGRGGSG